MKNNNLEQISYRVKKKKKMKEKKKELPVFEIKNIDIYIFWK